MPIKTEKKIGKDRNKYIHKDMANPIKKDELVTDEALGQLKLMADRLTIIAENLTKAKEACQSWGEEEKKNSATTSNNVDELSKMSARITQLEDAIKKLNAAEKENENARRSVNEQKRLYRKLTDDEIKSVEDLKRALQGSVDEQMKAVNAIEVEKKSYNELNQVYNALKDSLNRMTTAQRQNTDAGKAMTAQASKVYETMNQLQQATGKYTLQVGKYRAAFDGLGYSFQQILREAPSALNLNQFFLAISNNIPLFLDQLKAFNAEQKAIKANLETMTKGTAEYAEQLSKVESVGKKLTKVLFSWQSLVLVGLLALRNLEKIKDWLDKIFNSMGKILSREKMLQQRISDLSISAMKAYKDEETELGLIIDNLRGVVQGTNEWKLGIERINEITKSNLSTTHATISEVEAVTDAYLEQMKVLAMNKQLIETLSGNDVNVETIGKAYAGKLSGSAAARQLGLSGDDAESFANAVDEYVRAMNFRNAMEKRFKKFALDPKYKGAGMMPFYSREYKAKKGTLDEAQSAMDDAWTVVENLVSEYKLLLDPRDIETLKSMYKNGGRKPKTPKTPHGRTYSLKDVDFLESELLDPYGVVELTSSFDQKLAMLEQQEKKERTLLNKKYERELQDLEFNHDKKLITDKEYEEQRLKLEQNYIAIIKTNEEGNFEQMGVIQRKYWNKRNELTAKEAEKEEKEALKREKKAIKDLEDAYASQYRVVQRRVKTVQQEIQHNQDLAFNISLAKEELAKLNEMVITAGEDATGYTDRINKLTQQIEKWRKQMQFDKQLSNYGSVWDIFQRNGAFEASNGTMRGIAKNLLGDLADSLDDEQIEQVYDTWLQNTQKAATEWYNTTMGYINDLISAYVELANAKAEAAKEATEAAQEEYDKEKALLEAGYASRVEATWAEYQEKKAAQEKAEEDAKAAAKAQQEINNLSTMGSLITAAANIWKTFTEIPVVGIPLAIAATGTMFGAFLAAKIKANEVSKYGDGGFEVLEGGSHASGHDIDLGVRNRRGRRMRAEGREGLGIFSRRAMSHYGANNIEAMVNSVNRLEFEGNAAKRMSLERSVGMAVLSAPRTDLHRVENSLDKLVSYGSRSRYTEADGTVVEVRKSGVVRYRK